MVSNLYVEHLLCDQLSFFWRCYPHLFHGEPQRVSSMFILLTRWTTSVSWWASERITNVYIIYKVNHICFMVSLRENHQCLYYWQGEPHLFHGEPRKVSSMFILLTRWTTSVSWWASERITNVYIIDKANHIRMFLSKLNF